MIAVILFFVVIVVFAIVFYAWGNSLDKREKELKRKETDVKEWKRVYQTQLAELHAKEDVYFREKEGLKERELNLVSRKESIMELEATLLNKQTYLASEESRINDKQKDADDAWQKCLEEGQRLMKWESDLADRLADIEAKERSLGLTEVPDIIEPVDEPVKPVKKARRAKK